MLAVEACQALASAYGEIPVDQQLGGTALPDLPAKPVLDIAAAVVTFDSMPEIVWRLTLLAIDTEAIMETREATGLSSSLPRIGCSMN
jgi:GrpB-like predicted nucleotidyltransferase (UPF0157 family)